MKILIKNGTLVFSDHRVNMNLLSHGDRITYIGKDEPAADLTIDARGCYVMPGFIDTHTHLELSQDRFGRDTEAAALGGCTSILEFVNQQRGGTMMAGYEIWMDWAKNSSVNYGFHMSLSEWNNANLQELNRMDEIGISSYKMYMVYDEMRVNDGEIYSALKGIKAHNGILGVHCENWELIAAITDELYRSGCTSAAGHPLSRPAPIEAEAVSRFLRIAQTANAPAYVVHLSTEAGLQEIRNARARGQEVYAETCPQYLMLTDECYSREDGVKYIMSPPLRKASDNAALWAAISDGEIDTIGTDHCSYAMAERLAYRNDFRQAPNGCAGLQHRGQLIYTYGVCENRFSLEKMVEILCTNPAAIFGMTDRGVLETGMIADIVVWDPNFSDTITDTNHRHDCDCSIYSGIPVKGRAREVLINGEPVVKNGELLSTGHGRYVKCSSGLHYRQQEFSLS